MFALDVVSKKIIDWKHKEKSAVQIPLDMLNELLSNPEKQHEIVKANYSKPYDGTWYEESLKFYNGNVSVYVRPNEDGTISKIAFETIVEKRDGCRITREEDLVLCNYGMLSAGFFLLETEFYGSRDESALDFIIDGMGRIWREILNAKVTE